MQVQILLVEEQTLAAEGIIRIIKSEKNYFITHLTNASMAVDYLRKNKIQIAIMGINNHGQSGVILMEKIKKISPEIKVIGLSMIGEYQKINKMLENGCDGYITNNTTCDEILDLLKQVMKGKIYLTSEVQQLIVKGIRDQKNIPPLTNKEKEVLQFIVKGFTNKEIAKELNVGDETIKSHRKNIMSKLNIHNTAELVRFAIERQIV